MMEMKNEVNLTWVKRGVVHCLGEKGVGEGVESFMYVQTDRNATTNEQRDVSLKTLEKRCRRIACEGSSLGQVRTYSLKGVSRGPSWQIRPLRYMLKICSDLREHTLRNHTCKDFIGRVQKGDWPELFGQSNSRRFGDCTYLNFVPSTRKASLFEVDSWEKKRCNMSRGFAPKPCWDKGRREGFSRVQMSHCLL